MSKVELYKSRTFVVIVHLIALIQFLYAMYYDYYYVNITDVIDVPSWPSIKIFQKLKYLTYWCLYWYGIYYFQTKVFFPDPKTSLGNPFAGKFKFLTFLNAIIQALYFSICVANDLVGSNEVTIHRLPPIRKIRDFLFASLAFPIALNVGVTFWLLMAIDRELVFPKVLDAIFPSWLNHVMHTNIVVFMLLEMCITFRTYPPRDDCVRILIGFMVTYLIWIHIIRYSSGFWVYPILEVLTVPLRIIFYVVLLGFTLLLYYMGEHINKMIWGKELKTASRKRDY